MLRRKASGFVAAMFATAAITGTAFAADLESNGIEAAPAETTVSAPAETSVTEAATTEAETPAGEVTETVPTEEVTEAPAADVDETTTTDAAEETAPVADETTAPADVDETTEGEAAVEETEGAVIETPVAEEAAPVEGTAPAEVVEEAAPIAEAEAATLTITHHFEYGETVCDDIETIADLTAGTVINAADYNYTDQYEFTTCTTTDAEMELAAGDNQVTLNYTLAEGYVILD